MTAIEWLSARRHPNVRCDFKDSMVVMYVHSELDVQRVPVSTTFQNHYGLIYPVKVIT